MLVTWPFSGFPHPVAKLREVRCQKHERSAPSASPQLLPARSERSSVQSCAELPFFISFFPFSSCGSVPEPTVQNVERVLPVFRCPTEFALHRVKEDLKIFSHRNICAKSLYAVTLDGRLCHNPCCYTIVGSFTSRGDWSCDISLLYVR